MILILRSSDAFSLAGNVQDGDSRAGLDVASKKEILKIMRSQKVGFDEARQLYMVQKLAKNGIAPDGRPMGKHHTMFFIFSKNRIARGLRFRAIWTEMVG